MNTVAEPEVDLTNVPELLRKQAEESRRLFSAAKEAIVEAGIPVAGEVATASEPEKPVEEVQEESVGRVSETPEPPKPLKTEVSVGDFKEVATEEMTKEQRFRVLEGMHKATSRELRAARAEAAAAQTLREENETLKKQIAERQAPVVAKAIAPSNERMTRLAESFGEENLNDLKATLREEFLADITPIREEVGRVAKTFATSAQERFEQQMEELVPKWKAINLKPEFIEKLDEEVGYTGETRRSLAMKFLANHDAPRLAQLFMDAMPEVPGETKVKTPVTPKLDKKKYSSPPSTPATARMPEEGQEVQPMKTSELEKFARDVIAGKYNGRDAERKAFEARKAAAVNAGKIISG